MIEFVFPDHPTDRKWWTTLVMSSIPRLSHQTLTSYYRRDPIQVLLFHQSFKDITWYNWYNHRNRGGWGFKMVIPKVGWFSVVHTSLSQAPAWHDAVQAAPLSTRGPSTQLTLLDASQVPKMAGWWLTYPSEKIESVGMIKIPTEWKVIIES